jgi:ribosome biogenesis GTPase
MAQHRGRWLVGSSGAGESRLLPARGRLRETPPVTGDWVAVDAAGAIVAVLERRGVIVRRAPGGATAHQVLAANVDLALIVEPASAPNERRLERLLALAGSDGVSAALVLTKADLADVDDPQLIAARLARQLGIADALAVSAPQGDGLSLVHSLLEPGSTAVLLGVSGVGKSTLVNALLGEQRQPTQPVREEDGRGRHTTVTRELLALPSGALLIDTPGLREVGLWDGAGDAFADVEALAARCRFADCAHETEPGCAVRGALAPDRIAAWRKLVREQAWIADRKRAAREREESGRSYRTVQREARRRKGDE